MDNIKWTKGFDLKVANRHFKVFVSEHEGEGFYASCLWHEVEGRMLKAHGQAGKISFKLETRFASNEKEALEQIKSWAKEKFGDDIQLVNEAE